ncbi:MAG: hypothetical protein ACE5QW_02655 [Thermoplasmata archaeon]
MVRKVRRSDAFGYLRQMLMLLGVFAVTLMPRRETIATFGKRIYQAMTRLESPLTKRLISW